MAMQSRRDVEVGLAWEKSKFAAELEQIRAETDAECDAILRRLSARGMLQSGAVLTEVIEAREYLPSSGVVLDR